MEDREKRGLGNGKMFSGGWFVSLAIFFFFILCVV